MVHPCNSSTQEAEVGESEVQGQPGLHSNILSQKNEINCLIAERFSREVLTSICSLKFCILSPTIEYMNLLRHTEHPTHSHSNTADTRIAALRRSSAESVLADLQGSLTPTHTLDTHKG